MTRRVEIIAVECDVILKSLASRDKIKVRVKKVE